MGESVLRNRSRDSRTDAEQIIRTPFHFRITMILLLGTHASLSAFLATRMSPTLNEPAHLVAGLSHWEFGRFELYRVNPPLVRMWATLPVLGAGYEADWSRFNDRPGSRPVFSMGEDFIAANGERSLWLMTLARWGCLPFGLIGAVVCFLWARDLASGADGRGQTATIPISAEFSKTKLGPSAHRLVLIGFVSLILWCFDPNILGHAALITPDIAATSLGLSAMYLFWRWLKQPDWMRTFAAGLALGLAQLTKMTWLILFPLWLFLWAIYYAGRPAGDLPLPSENPAGLAGRSLRRQLGQLTSILLLGLYLLNLGYGFDGTLTKLKDFQFVSKTLTDTTAETRPQQENCFAKSWLGELPVPLPKQYVLGLDVQKRDFEDYVWPSYLRGEWRQNGWWYYYVYGLAVKLPLGTWGLLLIVIAGRLTRSLPCVGWRDEFVLLAPAAVVLVVVSSQTGFNHHLRYVLPALPFLFIYASQSAQFFWRFRPTLFPILVRIAVVVCLVWTVTSSLIVYPHSLGYFNELAGGPSNGHKHLIHSSLDWGQDLLSVKEWLAAHPEAQPFYLAYNGSFGPQHIGIQFALPPQKPENADEHDWLKQLPAGWYAISVNYVCGDRRAAFDGTGKKQAICDRAYTSFQNLTPTARLGASIWLYSVHSTAVK